MTMTDFTTNIQSEDACPRCSAGRLRRWRELDEEEREVVRLLPLSAKYTPDEREASHRWCTRCWHEATNAESHNA